MKNVKFITMLTFIILSAINDNVHAGSIQPNVSHKTYAIKSIPFSGYKTTSDINGMPIIFSEYGKTVKVSYPAPKEPTIQDASLIIKNCREIFGKNVDQIARIEDQDSSVKDYLTFEGNIHSVSKEMLLGIVTDPREKTLQKNSSMGKIVAEFRSKEFQIDNNTAFCIYLTFVCSQDKGVVEKIIISAVKLES